ncbi:hypothetical protein GC207_01860 [bacterium]|nr:hypothetical protein [bacterium]
MNHLLRDRKVGIVAVLLVTVIGIVWFTRPTKFEGRTIEDWVRDLKWVNRDAADASARRVLLAANTNAIPYLLSALVRTDAWWVTKGNELLEKKTSTTFRFKSVNKPVPLASAVGDAFNVLTNRAAPAVPQLIKIYTNHTDENVRAQAAVCLGWIGPSASNAVEVLILGSASTNDNIANNSVWALGKIGGDSGKLIPVFTNLLRPGVHTVIRDNAAFGLRTFGTNASSAVPFLLNMATNSSNDHLYFSALNALEKIDPKIAEKLDKEHGDQHGSHTRK